MGGGGDEIPFDFWVVAWVSGWMFHGSIYWDENRNQTLVNMSCLSLLPPPLLPELPIWDMGCVPKAFQRCFKSNVTHVILKESLHLQREWSQPWKTSQNIGGRQKLPSKKGEDTRPQKSDLPMGPVQLKRNYPLCALARLINLIKSWLYRNLDLNWAFCLAPPFSVCL